jgi:predicted negative regulator of RcsB-dependent stress response
MPSSQRRLTRKQLKGPDEFLNFFERLRDFIANNLTQVMMATGVVVVAAILLIAVLWYQQTREQAAGEKFYAALAALNSKDYKAAEQGFSTLAREEPDRRVGKLARFYLANAYAGQNQFTKARDALAAFIAEFRDPNFASLALTGLGAMYERLGDLPKAASSYRQAAQVDGPAQLRAQLSLARALATMGDRNGAVQAYRDFLAAHPYSQERQQVLESLALLGASAQAPQARAASGAVKPVLIKPAAGAGKGATAAP